MCPLEHARYDTEAGAADAESEAAVDASLCADEHDLCEDFDHYDGAFHPAWQLSNHLDGRMFIDDAGYSPPYEAVVEVDAADTTGASAERSFGARGSGARCALKIFIDALEGVDELAVLEMTVTRSMGGNAKLQLVRRPTTWALHEIQGPISMEQGIGLEITPGDWRDVTLDWTFGPADGGGAYTITVGPLSQRRPALVFDSSNPLQPSVTLGALIFGAQSTHRIRYDDVVCDVKP